ncbi:BppU family phage baseplate upper protein [Bacillus luti]|uniref:BppU family phage baseplate upper protein n=1 Tax=Bacillus luti TaxID=2026191 RepID=UPI003D01F66E
MTFKTRELTVDLVNEISTNEIRFSQGDENSAKLVLNITNQGQELDLSKATAVCITFEKSDGKTVFQQDCQVINAMKGKYQVVLKTQTLAVIGNVYGQVQIIEGDQKIDSQVFVFTVKRSLSSNQAVESKNEFTIIQRALEVGEQFKGVDFAPIIAAGALAQGSLPKTGGTMTGALVTESKVTWKNKEGTGEVDFAVASDGVLWITDKKTNTTVATIKNGSLNIIDSNLVKKAGDVLTGTLNFNTSNIGTRYATGANYVQHSVNGNGVYQWNTIGGKVPVYYDIPADNFMVTAANTNVMKKTGDSISGELLILAGPNKGITIRGAVNQMSQSVDANGDFYWYASNTKTPVKYNFDTDTFTIHAANTNVVKKGGDTMTGDLAIDRATSASYRDIRWTTGENVDVLLGNDTSDNWRAYHTAGNTGVFSYNKTSKTFNITAPNTNAVLKTKDGRATITVTADAELIGPNGVVADRRGNTVSLRAPIRRKAGSTGAVVFTMPVDMRPSMLLTQTVVTNDGTPALLTVSATNGEVLLQQIGASITGKDINIVLSYVVD